MSNPTDPVVTSDGSLTLHSQRYNQTYHSVHGAHTESTYVYLAGGGVLDKLQQRQHTDNPVPVRVLEVGLGLGVNAMLTAVQAAHFQVPVEYVGIEHDFQSQAVIRKVLAEFPDSQVSALCRAIETADELPGESTSQRDEHVLETAVRLNSHFQLHILPMDLSAALEAVLHRGKQRFDAVYLDAFSPDSNPECWTADILAKLGQTLSQDGRLTTYCAKGSVRRALQSAGLNVTRRPGPPGKRECLVASL